MGNCLTGTSNTHEKTIQINTNIVDSELLNATYKNIPKFMPDFTVAKVIKVYDGDTITVAARCNERLYKWSVRLYGIDTPELRTDSAREKELGYAARDILKEKIMPNGNGEMIRVFIRGYDKYGRVLADIYHKNVHINMWMINRGYAVSYDGGTKSDVFK